MGGDGLPLLAPLQSGFQPLFLSLLFRCLAPIPPLGLPCTQELQPSSHPVQTNPEGEAGGDKEGGHEDHEAHDAGAGPIEASLKPFRQQVSDQPSGFGGAAGADNRSILDQPPHRHRLGKQQCQKKATRAAQAKQAENLGGRRADGLRAQPFPAKNQENDREKERGVSEGIQQQIGQDGSILANEVVHRILVDQVAGYVERRVRRMVGDQA